MRFIIRQPETADEFEQYYFLRWQVLRKPWAQPQGFEKDDIEDSCFHLIALSPSADDSLTRKPKTVTGVSRLQFNTAETAQIRYMAVSPSYRNKGIARALMDAMEKQAQDRNISKIVLDGSRSTALLYAARKNKVSTVELLIERGATVDTKDKFGRTPFTIAATVGNVEVVEALYKAKANINHQDATRKTALFWSSDKEHADTVHYLLEQKADPDIAEAKGMTPLDYAIKKNRGDIIAILEKHDARTAVQISMN